MVQQLDGHLQALILRCLLLGHRGAVWVYNVVITAGIAVYMDLRLGE